MNRNQQLEKLIKELSPTTKIPIDISEKWRLFRALVNRREPKPVTAEFIKIQDELLKSLIAESGITDIDELHPIRENLYLWRGDITTLKVDAIVNAANSSMLGCFVPCHACIDNAIHTFAGVQIRTKCSEIMQKQDYPEPTGQAKVTEAYNLPSKYILHTVGPIINSVVHDKDKQLLSSCYRSCLELAEQHKLSSVAFCCISTGEFRFPNEEAAVIAVNTVSDWLKTSQYVKRMVFNVFTDKDQRIYESLLGQH